MSVLELGQQQVALGVGVHALNKRSESGGGVDTGVSVRHGVPFRLGVRARLGASGSVRSVQVSQSGLVRRGGAGPLYATVEGRNTRRRGRSGQARRRSGRRLAIETEATYCSCRMTNPTPRSGPFGPIESFPKPLTVDELCISVHVPRCSVFGDLPQPRATTGHAERGRRSRLWVRVEVGAGIDPENATASPRTNSGWSLSIGRDVKCAPVRRSGRLHA